MKMRNPILVHYSTCAQRRQHDFDVTPFTLKKKLLCEQLSYISRKTLTMFKYYYLYIHEGKNTKKTAVVAFFIIVGFAISTHRALVLLII